MALHPATTAFTKHYDLGKAQVVWTDLVADMETPVSAMLKLAKGQPNSFLLESVERGANRGRYSIIGLRPDVIWRCSGNRAELARDADAGPVRFAAAAEDALASLRALVRESRMELPSELPPMASALMGYAGYDMVRLVERIPNKNPDVLGVPDGMFVRPTVMAIFDSVKDVVNIVTPVWPKPGVTAAQALSRATERLERAMRDLETPLHPGTATTDVSALPEPTSNRTRAQYHAMVAKAKEYIAAGDIFQVVPSQRMKVPFTLPPFALYRALRRTNPSPFMFFLDFDGFAVVGSSPEVLVRLRDDTVSIRPIAGTRPRGATHAEDSRLAEEMLADPKERAEHLMLLDLGRNDVGRVARIGTVKVTDKMIVERYSHVMHIVSNVEGKIDPKHDAMDALLAGFPAGTVSGAPKVRAMEIIDELESERRGIYAGAIGYLSANGSMDTCIALRTAVVKDGVMYVQAGGGVVADSDPEAEYQESRNKAKALLRAAEEAVRFATSDDKSL
ncbi:MAG: anthranilate synthase component I [Alphaproteobacteria bacterium]|nr:anthranilate synthase component I [Alphaproteobacteria bacterium]